MPLYGRAFTDTAGPGEKFNGIGPGSWEEGVWDYKALPQEGSVVQTRTDIGASFTWNEETQTLISYDNVEVAAMKANYIKENGLGGGMWWELSGDREGSDSLVEVVSHAPFSRRYRIDRSECSFFV